MQASGTAVIFGAGSVGRGFLGQLFSESGYRVVFIDIDEALVKALALRANYTLRLSGIDHLEDLKIGPVRAVNGRQIDQAASEVVEADLVATAVGAQGLGAVARTLAAGLAWRWQTGRTAPLNVIVCENLPNAPDLLREQVCESLPETLRESVQERVGFVPAVIARMSPAPTAEQRMADPTLIVAEPYKVLPVDRDAFVGIIPHVVGMEPVAPFAAYVARKLYLHNAAHAVLGYLGYRRGHAYGYQALADGWLQHRLDQALDEAGQGLAAEYHFAPAVLQAHIQDLLVRFGNRALADPIDRLCRDPLRKLAPTDRLVGAARLAEKHQVQPVGLARGIAAALSYDNLADADAMALQDRLSQAGLARVMQEVCGIREHEPLTELVCGHYRELESLSMKGIE